MSARPIVPPLPEGVSVRLATIDDAPTVSRLRSRMFEAMGVAEETTPEAEALTLAYFKHAIPDREFVAWLAEVDGEAIGSTGVCVMVGPPCVEVPDGRIARLLNVFVDERWRGRGIARAMIVEAMDECVRMGHGRIGLAATEQGRPVYETLGFEQDPEPEMSRSLEEWLD